MRISDWSSDVCSSDLSVVRSFDRDPYGRFIDGPAVFDQRAGILYTIIGGGAKDRLVAYTWPLPGQTEGFDARLVAEWPKAGMKAWGLAQHASGLLVLWDGHARVLIVDRSEEHTSELQSLMRISY